MTMAASFAKSGGWPKRSRTGYATKVKARIIAPSKIEYGIDRRHTAPISEYFFSPYRFDAVIRVPSISPIHVMYATERMFDPRLM